MNFTIFSVNNILFTTFFTNYFFWCYNDPYDHITYQNGVGRVYTAHGSRGRGWHTRTSMQRFQNLTARANCTAVTRRRDVDFFYNRYCHAEHDDDSQVVMHWIYLSVTACLHVENRITACFWHQCRYSYYYNQYRHLRVRRLGVNIDSGCRRRRIDTKIVMYAELLLKKFRIFFIYTVRSR